GARRAAPRRRSEIRPGRGAADATTRVERYARHAAAHLRAWVVDDRTRMNPSLLYAQAIKGRATGRGTGLIDTIHLVEVARAVWVLEHLGYKDDALPGTKQWFHQYLDFLVSHPYGNDERTSGNNHAAAWALQVAEFAHLVRD